MSASGEDGSTRRDFLPEEDTVEYRLYSPEEEDEGPLAKMAAECTQHARHITRDHIWHYDSFSLEVCAGKRGEGRGAESLFTLCIPSRHVLYMHHRYLSTAHLWQHLLS